MIFDGKKEERTLHHNSPIINDDNYYDDRYYITNSMLGKLKESPAVLQEYLAGGGFLTTKALSIGDALHKSILEPDKFISTIKTWSQNDLPVPDKTMRTKANKDWLTKFVEDNPSMTILKDVEHDMVLKMRDSIIKKAEAYTKGEHEYIALKEINGVAVKSKGDILHEDGETLVDIKTTGDCSLESFKESCEKYGYYRQAAMYCDMFERKKFAFLVVEKKAPFKVAYYEVSKSSMDKGRKEYMDLLEQYKYYFKEDMFGDRVEEHLITGIL
jgi:exodeoxyribonuclease VIII